MILAVSYLAWTWRILGGTTTLAVACATPFAWFAGLAAVARDASAGPLGGFWAGSAYNLLWVGLAAVLAAILPVARPCAAGVAARDPWTAATGAWTTRLRRRIARIAGTRGPCASSPWFCARVPVVIACLLSVLAGVCLTGTGLVASAPRGVIRVHNFGGLDWERPVFGQFGAFSTGMFGLLPVYCRAEGYDFGVIEHTQAIALPKAPNPADAPKEHSGRAGGSPTEAKAKPPSTSKSAPASPAASTASEPGPFVNATAAITGPAVAATATTPPLVIRYTDAIEPADLAGTQILVLINSPKEWKDPDRRVVLDFVARGGSLLVLGDHTDVFGLMRGFNTLLGPLGIKLRFDSAYKARASWRGCQAAAPDLVAWGWEEENPGVAVGASLELSSHARPLLVGRYAFSDAGIRENVMGSLLGNYHYDPGEQLGDVVLVATTTYGRGRIVVWGDTSAFQGGLSTSYRKVVGPMLAWLSRPAAWTEMPAVRIAAAIGLLAIVLWCWIVAATPKQIAWISASLLVGMLAPWALSWPTLYARPRVDRDAFLIDRSHFEATAHYEAKVNPIGPLYTNLFRSGFRVLDTDTWDSNAINRARGIAFVAPQKSFSRREVDELLGAEREGAVVILATGQPDSAGARPLLDAHGLALVPRPLGTVTPAEPTASRREREQQPRFIDAWPIVAADGRDPETLAAVEVIYRHGDDVVVLFHRVGKGGLLLISDTRFFSDMNVEDMSGYWLGNLALIHDMFKQYLGADPDSVKPLFRSPEKPR
jgi:hypothetical protein